MTVCAVSDCEQEGTVTFSLDVPPNGLSIVRSERQDMRLCAHHFEKFTQSGVRSQS